MAQEMKRALIAGFLSHPCLAGYPANMTLEPISYECGGVELIGYLANGSTPGSAPGILIAHESPGITEHIKQQTLGFAKQGYVAFALDLFGAHNLDLEEARRQSGLIVHTPGLMYARTKAGLDVLADQPTVDPTRIGAVGFCLGGAAVLELARHDARIQCVIGFHPGFLRPAGSLDSYISARVLMMIGDQDPIVAQEDRLAFARAMDASSASWELHVFGGVGHSFTNPAIDSYCLTGFAYNADAARRSWMLALGLLQETLR